MPSQCTLHNFSLARRISNAGHTFLWVPQMQIPREPTVGVGV